MRRIGLFALAVAFATGNVAYVGSAPAFAKDGVVAGKMIYTSDKHLLGSVYSVKKDGSVEVIVDTQIVTVPSATIETKEGKVWTTLSRKDILRSH